MEENQAWFRFYEELNDFLPAYKRKITFPYYFKGSPSVKDAIESIGVPHAEVDLVIANGNSVSFYYKLKDGDQISVYPVFESLNISTLSHLRPVPLRTPKFVVDVHLGRLSKYLRLMGFDTFFEEQANDSRIIKISMEENRTILTRDRNLLKNKKVSRGYWIRSQNPKIQLKEVIQKFDLVGLIKPFTRCLECNNIVVKVPKTDVFEELEHKTREYYTEFWKCPGCNRIYWEGSHFTSMKKFLELILSA